MSRKPKVKFKTPCLYVKITKTRPVNRGKRRSNGKSITKLKQTK